MQNRYLEILELHPGATKAEIKTAYRRLSKVYHPDLNKSESAQEKFIEVTEAYRFLMEVGPRPHQETINYAYNPQAEEYRRRREMAREYARKMAELDRKRIAQIRNIVQKFNYAAVTIVLLNLLLALDAKLPKRTYEGALTRIEKVTDLKHEEGRYFREYAFDEVYIDKFKLRIEKGKVFEAIPYKHVVVESTFLFNKPVSVIFTKNEELERFSHLGSIYSVFRYFIPLMLLAFIFYEYIMKSPENKLTMAIVITLLFFIQVGMFTEY